MKGGVQRAHLSSRRLGVLIASMFKIKVLKVMR
jgi:hypothetical protein